MRTISPSPENAMMYVLSWMLLYVEFRGGVDVPYTRSCHDALSSPSFPGDSGFLAGNRIIIRE